VDIPPVDRVRAALDAVIAEHHLENTDELISLECTPIADFIARCRSSRGRCVVIGLAGAQGSGKSTVAALVGAQLLAGRGFRMLALALDDFYLQKARRAELARTVHPLLATRGVPGTHDTAELLTAIRNARALGKGDEIDLPQFSKADDDRRSERRVERGPFDVVLLEGWCIGARPQAEADLIEPINAFEREEDSDGQFRRYANHRLAGAYAEIWAELEGLVFLAVPRFEAVFEFRREQEHKLRRAEGANAGMSDAQLERFVRHYERITRHMLRDMPSHSDVVVRLGEQRKVMAVVERE
jgi:D-glycerate 3-kinase